ncbi:hypothetical protein BU24DRAFT_463511 [Aaosphaeria arxii CBS 175.79]|uniref:RRM domain-containing protein n=1 Tax=Aaosphaeria arxii CBS 175.79 TaxID=1450172 RepID=A0A6A5XPC1_9PLEO|nr:uncharacterized protein BU24DRAFT_463511 [Aaosphaeria arxii CBS 175.79]KAF2014749.1 hypothetical protein BU24DRAFT_463511 [Aaosphaeria arxii CBS 175.79]
MSSLSPVNKSLQKELPLPPRVSSIHLEKGNKDGWVAIELNNYSSDITQTDVAEVFTNFQVEEFRIPDFKKFHMPLRMRLQVKGEKEAERAIRELSGKVVHGRSIGIDRLQDPRSDTNSDARNWGHTEHSHAISNKQHDAE